MGSRTDPKKVNRGISAARAGKHAVEAIRECESHRASQERSVVYAEDGSEVWKRNQDVGYAHGLALGRQYSGIAAKQKANKANVEEVRIPQRVLLRKCHVGICNRGISGSKVDER